MMQWMAIWMHPYGHQTHGGGLSCELAESG